MGSSGVSELVPENDVGGGDSPAPDFAYTNAFKKVFPHYLALGMTYEQFWNQDVELVRFYREAAKIKRDLRNQDLWLQGAYIYEAILDAAPVLQVNLGKKPRKPTPYREQPYDLEPGKKKKDTKQVEKLSKQEKNDGKAKSIMEMWMVNINKKFEKKGGGENG